MQSYELRDDRFYFSSSINNLKTAPHLHREVELIYIEEGELEIRCSSTEYLLEKGDLFVAFPNVVHEYIESRENKCMMWIFDGAILGDLFTELKRKMLMNPVVKASHQHDDVKYGIYSFKELGVLRNADYLSKAYLSLIMVHVVGDLETTDIGGDDHNEWMSELLYYINEHFCEQLSLEKLSSTVGVSKYHLSRTFATKMNCSIPNYINKLRVQKAVEMVQYTDETITEIAFSCGFESMPTFFRAFKKEGLPSPKTVRIGAMTR